MIIGKAIILKDAILCQKIGSPYLKYVLQVQTVAPFA